MKLLTLLAVFGIFLGGCYKISPEEDELRTVPTTNNPNVFPSSPRPNTLPAAAY